MQLRFKRGQDNDACLGEQKSLEGASSSMEDHESVAAVSTGATTIETRSGSQAPLLTARLQTLETKIVNQNRLGKHLQRLSGQTGLAHQPR